MRIAITGNIGCGKTTFTQMLLKHLEGYGHFCVDTAVRELYNDPSFCATLRANLGTDVRSEVSEIVFVKNPERREWLEDITKHKIGMELEIALTKRDVVVEFPLVYEMGSSTKFDHIIACFCDEATQEARVKARDNVTPSKLARIRAAQLSTQVKNTMADTVVDTGVDLVMLDSKAKAVANTIKMLSYENHFLSMFKQDERKEAGRIFEKLVAKYRSKWRVYHNEHHIHAMLDQAMKLADRLNYPAIVFLSIWFHDAVYETTKDAYQENEARSVKFMMNMFKQHVPEVLTLVRDNVSYISAVSEFILATKKHEITSPYILGNEKLLHDCQVLLDLDLSILGNGLRQANEFDERIVVEFDGMYDDYTFAIGRRDALKHLLSRSKVFMSEYFTDKEENARSNLASLIEKWENKL